MKLGLAFSQPVLFCLQNNTGLYSESNTICIFGYESNSGDRVGLIGNNTRTIFGRSYAAEPEQLIKELSEDEAIQEADKLLLTIPNTLGVDYNVHVLSSILKYVAPELAWR